MGDVLTLEERVLARLMSKIESDRSVPSEVALRIRALCEEGRLKDSNAILDAVRRGIEDHAKNSQA